VDLEQCPCRQARPKDAFAPSAYETHGCGKIGSEVEIEYFGVSLII
jgi:hypothetical protein